jgi:imidazolonepropionase-like amidohydrolase
LRLIANAELYDLHGTFREVRTPEKLVLNWRWDKDSPLAGSPGDTEVTIEFFARGGRTDLVLTQSGFRNEESRGQYERGWHRCFREMEKLLTFVPPESLTRWKDFIRVSSPIVALEHATVIEGTGVPAKRDQTIVFLDGRITALGPSGSVEVPANAKRLDLTGYTAFPGLVDMHGHLFYVSNFFNTDDLLAHIMPLSFPRLYLASGVTTIRTAGTFEPYADLDIKKAVDAGTLIGPKMHVTGPYLTGEGYPLVQLYALTGPEDARRTVEYWAREGATSFKLYTDLPRAVAKAAIDEAHRWGLPVTGHLGSIGFREAAELGIDNVEHGLWVDTEFAPDKRPDLAPATYDATAADMDINGEAIQSMIKALVDHHVAVTSTIAVWEQFALHSAASERVLGALSERDRKISADSRLLEMKKMTDGTPHEKEEHERFVRMLRKEAEFQRAFVRAGGLLLAGSDAVIDVFIAGFGDQREVEMLVEGGFTAEQAIQIASLNGAQFLKESHRIGSLAPGKQADIVIVKGDPSKNIRDIENVEIVFKDGVGFDSKKLLESVRGQVGIH